MTIRLLALAALHLVAFSLGSRASGQIHQVNVGSRNLVATCLGEGQPTVVLESGLGDDASVWTNTSVRSSIAAFSRVCAYSRAGLGSSDPAAGQRTLQSVVNDLDALLQDGFIDGPVVLVGHSIGGLIANVYAHQQPRRVAGLVLIDSSHPDQETAFREVRPAAMIDALAAYDRQNAPPETWFSPAVMMQGETVYMEPGSLGDLPVVVLTADPSLVDEAEVDWIKRNVWSGYNGDLARAEDRVWAALQKQYVGLSSNARHTVVEGSSHYVQSDRPEVVVGAIRAVVQAVRTGEPLAQGGR